MKKVNLNGKLSLKKETIAKLNNEQMNVVKGGASGVCQLPPISNKGGSECPTHPECAPTWQLSNCPD